MCAPTAWFSRHLCSFQSGKDLTSKPSPKLSNSNKHWRNISRQIHEMHSSQIYPNHNVLFRRKSLLLLEPHVTSWVPPLRLPQSGPAQLSTPQKVLQLPSTLHRRFLAFHNVFLHVSMHSGHMSGAHNLMKFVCKAETTQTHVNCLTWPNSLTLLPPKYDAANPQNKDSVAKF